MRENICKPYKTSNTKLISKIYEEFINSVAKKKTPNKPHLKMGRGSKQFFPRKKSYRQPPGPRKGAQYHYYQGNTN